MIAENAANQTRLFEMMRESAPSKVVSSTDAISNAQDKNVYDKYVLSLSIALCRCVGEIMTSCT